jgi:6-phosphogluconolactonase (cycloisomerase 2 family)
MRFTHTICTLTVFAFLSRPICAAAGDAGIKFSAEIKQDSAPNLKLNWTSHTYVKGAHLFVISHRDGRINTFKRDVKTGEVKFMAFHDLATQLGSAGRHLDAYTVLTDKNILYATGEWTHSTGNASSLGLSWYQFSPDDGSLKLLGNIPCDAGSLVEAPDGKSLYLSAFWSEAIYHVHLDKDGKPSIGAKVSGKGLRSRAVLSPDRNFLYALSEKDVGWVEIKKDGTLAYAGSSPLTALESPASLRSKAIALSPDGKHVYVALWTYKYNGMGLFNRDPKTGALTFARKVEVDHGMQGLNHIVFEADGLTGYWGAGPETPGSGVGWFKRDPESGNLSFGGKAPKSVASCHFTFCPDSGALYAAGYWSTKSFWIFNTK